MAFKAFRRIVFAALAAGAMAGCSMTGSLYGSSSNGGMTGPGYNGASAAGIDISNLAFAPSTVTFPASKNVTITWTNLDGFAHTVTSDASSGPLVFDSGNVGSNGTFKLTVPTTTAAGTYTYHCNIHKFMHGSITVQ